MSACPAGRQTIDALKSIGQLLYRRPPSRLSQLADIQFQSSPTSIHHYDKDRYTTITAFVRNGYNTTQVTMASSAAR
jgi:multidrug efflux pump subunit AcrB